MKTVSNPIHIIGVSAAGVEDLSSNLKDLVISTKRIAGPTRILYPLIEWWHQQKNTNQIPEFFKSDNPSELITWLSKQREQTVVFASGDPLWFGIGRLITENFSDKEIIFHPSPTSLQLAFSRIGRPWQDASWVSLHGRDPSALKKHLQKRPKAIAILTDPKRGGALEVKNILRALELEKHYTFWIFERLGHKKERVFKILPSEKIPKSIDPLNLVVLIEDQKSELPEKNLPLFGLEDDIFLQYDDRPGLLTKREVRVQILAELELPKEGVIWDIGAGVGSIGLESLRLNPKLKLLLVDERIGSKKLITANAKKLSVKPCKIIESEALKVIDRDLIPNYLSKPKRVIIGGGGEKKLDIINKVLSKLNKDGVLIIPSTTLEGLNAAEKILKKWNCLIKISQHQSYRGIPIANSTRLMPMNPVFIIKAKFK